MAATRFLRMSRPLGHGFSEQVFSNSGVSRPRVLMCLSKSGQCSENPPGVSGGERKTVPVKAAGNALACVVVEPRAERVVDLDFVMENVLDAISDSAKFISKKRSWRGFHLQNYIEKAIIDCRFFTMLAIAGSLTGSVLCFVEGCFLVLNSYFQYFHALSHHLEQANVVFQVIESIDMFLVGTAMLTFGMALHVMFIGSNVKASPSTNFCLQKLQSWMGIESVMQAKSKIGHAMMMILQVEVLKKFKSIPVTNGLDLACFAGVVFLSSASVILLSRLNVLRAEASH